MHAARDTARAVFGFEALRPGQEAVIERVLRGEDTLALMPTGSGKSLCYQLPALMLDRCVVVISPLIALMKDQLDGMPDALAGISTAINSTLSRDEIRARLAAIADRKNRLVYAAPERLRHLPFVDALRRAGVALFVVDEAHCICLSGYDFRPDYLFIRDALRMLGESPLLALTATASPAMADEIAEVLGRKLHRVSTGALRPNLRLEIQRVPDNAARVERIRELCRRLDGPGIVYVNARARAEDLARLLRQDGAEADFYHAGLASPDRAERQDRFMAGKTRIIVTTAAFGMGVDKADVRFVLHADLPSSLEGYVHESGRAGRDGAPASCVAVLAPGDRGNLSRWAYQERPTTELALAVERAFRSRAEVGIVAVPVDDLRRDVGDELDIDVDETQVRVALSLLERAEVLDRRMDLPRVLSIFRTRRGLASAPAELHAFVAAAHLQPGQGAPWETAELAEATGIPCAALEGKLLEWQAGGWLRVRASGRDPCVELREHDQDARERISELIDDLARIQEQRIADLFAFVEQPACRHAALARYLRVPEPAACEACDRCAPARRGVRAVIGDWWGRLSGRRSRSHRPDWGS